MLLETKVCLGRQAEPLGREFILDLPERCILQPGS